MLLLDIFSSIRLLRGFRCSDSFSKLVNSSCILTLIYKRTAFVLLPTLVTNCAMELLVNFQREMKKPSIGKEYFSGKNLEAIVANYPYRKNLTEEDIKKGTPFCPLTPNFCFL